ncbi:MAG: hypothetical protein CL609_06210 [Anaerolineaceae bacterium]|nr:hypothetical protein [Anaerolineaceae bacterium]
MKNQDNEPKKNNGKLKQNLFKKVKISFGVGIILIFLVVAASASGGYLLHLSNTSPEFCGSCHLMDENVNSYLTSNHLDNVHFQAGVECKECHDYSVGAEISSGVNFLLGNYSVSPNGELLKVQYDDQMCLDCHISYEFMGRATDYLFRNPHNNHNGELECRACHMSHEEQIDFCSSCHSNGGQRMIEDETTEREITY